MLDFFGTIAGNILSLPGILGLALGMMTRNWSLAASMGGFVGILNTLIFAHFSFAEIAVYDLLIAVAVGAAAGVVGCAIRHKGSLA
ncbi:MULTISPECIES: hypothetical protein [unclassified Meridianimarinicoccus]|uniref:hypothetical protein n=1 Tax=unclassified Meridianimarinicoccus TaxID=2923344 RepID=UPI001867063A|nr:hypothetical protein [Fluviibacterium sp. MJW13]